MRMKKNNPLIYKKRKNIPLDWQYEYKKFCRYKDTKTAIRHIRNHLIDTGRLGVRELCEVDGCNERAIIHEKSYNFDDAFKQDNYEFLPATFCRLLKDKT